MQQTLVEPGPPGDGFGSTVAASGQTLAVGNPQESSVAVGSGAVYIFTEIGTNWLFQAKLKASDPVASVRFGSRLAIDGNTVVAGAPASPGAAYVFVRDGTNWTQQQKLIAPPGQPADGFGGDVAVEGDVAVISGQQVLNGTNNGAVYVFTRSGTIWTLQQTLTLPGSETNLVFANVAIRNGEIVLGIPGRDVDGFVGAGSVAIFDFNGTSWVLIQEVTASDAKSIAFLGSSLDVGAAGIIAGAPSDRDVGRSSQGAAYIFSTGATNPPTISASASPNVLFPPNHKLVPVTITVSDEGFSSCHIVSVTSNEPITGNGKGKGKSKNSDDVIITGDLTLLLRAERSGQAKSGRIYTITIECTDNLGNTAQTSVTVTVPHNRRR